MTSNSYNSYSYLCRCKCGRLFISVYPTTIRCKRCIAVFVNSIEDRHDAEWYEAMNAYDGFDSLADEAAAVSFARPPYVPALSAAGEACRIYAELADGLTRKTGRWQPVILLVVIAALVMAVGFATAAGQADAQGWGQ